MIRKIVAGLVTSWLGASAAAEAEPKPRAPYVASPDRVVERMLDLGQVGPGDYVMDLGSGDGRIVIQAAQRGAHGLGVERKRRLVEAARANAERDGAGDRAVFREGNLATTDVTEASVITLYLTPEANAQVRPRLLEQLRPGARIISHGFVLGLWEADETIEVKIDRQPPRTVHLWVVPARMGGWWRWWVGNRRFDWQVDQDHGKLDTTLQADETAVSLEDIKLRGRQIAFATEHHRIRYAFSGRVEGASIEGTVHVQKGGQGRVLEWHARRQ